MKRAITLGVGVLALAGMALPSPAADLGRPVLKAPVAVPPPFTWTGCYIGGNVGWIGGNTKGVLTPAGTYLNAAGAAAPPNAAGTGLLAGDIALTTRAFSFSDDGWTGGGQVGCNWQTGALVLGGEADINFSGIDHSFSRTFAPIPSVSPGFTIGQETDIVNKKLEWFSTIRGRIGFAFDHFLLYATGGVVIADFKSATNVGFLPSGALPVFDTAIHAGAVSDTRAKGVVGGGVEWAFAANWSAKVEYLYFNLGTLNYVSPLVAPAGVAAGYAWATSIKENNNIVRVGLNYRF